MKQLVCEMCGNTDLIKQDGVFVCQSCGCKYSLEEAKKMMVEGTVRVDNTHMIENYLEMANRAYQSDNNSEAENYCNKVIEIDPNNCRALMLKGKAAGWQSTLQNNRFAEAISCFSSAIENAPEDEKDDLIDEAKTQVENLSAALMSLQGDRFVKWPDDEEATGLLKVVREIYETLIQFITSIGAGIIDKDELMAPIATQMNNSVMSAWNSKIVPEYRNDTDGHPDDYAFKQLISRASFCTDILELAIKLSDNDDAADITRYENLIAIHEYLISSCSYEYKTVSAGYSIWDGSTIWENRYVKNLGLNDSAKSARRSLISRYQTDINNIKTSIARKKLQKKPKRNAKLKKRQKNVSMHIGLSTPMIRLVWNLRKKVCRRRLLF